MASTSSTSSTVSRSTNLENYSLGQVLGQGAYGKVILSKEIATQRTVAIKEVNKKQIISLGKSRHIFREKDLLFEMDNPFIIKLLGTTQDENNLYFVFENCAKGDLSGLIQERSKQRMCGTHEVRISYVCLKFNILLCFYLSRKIGPTLSETVLSAASTRS